MLTIKVDLPFVELLTTDVKAALKNVDQREVLNITNDCGFKQRSDPLCLKRVKKRKGVKETSVYWNEELFSSLQAKRGKTLDLFSYFRLFNIL